MAPLLLSPPPPLAQLSWPASWPAISGHVPPSPLPAGGSDAPGSFGYHQWLLPQEGEIRSLPLPVLAGATELSINPSSPRSARAAETVQGALEWLVAGQALDMHELIESSCLATPAMFQRRQAPGSRVARPGSHSWYAIGPAAPEPAWMAPIVSSLLPLSISGKPAGQFPSHTLVLVKGSSAPCFGPGQ